MVVLVSSMICKRCKMQDLVNHVNIPLKMRIKMWLEFRWPLAKKGQSPTEPRHSPVFFKKGYKRCFSASSTPPVFLEYYVDDEIDTTFENFS